MFANNVAIIWLQRYGNMVVYGYMALWASEQKRRLDGVNWCYQLGKESQKKTLLLGIAENGVGNPLPKLILTLF